jgi:hypothetical protein
MKNTKGENTDGKFPTWEEFNESKRLWCRKCGEEMKSVNMGGGDFAIFGTTAHYCDNKECERFGDLTVAGIKK